jgi:hypothetical protein
MAVPAMIDPNSGQLFESCCRGSWPKGCFGGGHGPNKWIDDGAGAGVVARDGVWLNEPEWDG